METITWHLTLHDDAGTRTYDYTNEVVARHTFESFRDYTSKIGKPITLTLTKRVTTTTETIEAAY